MLQFTLTSSGKHLGRGAANVVVAVFSFLLFTTTAKAAFQEALWGARPSGLGGTFTALADDANAPAYNPAGISFISHNELTFMYARLFSGLDLQAGDQTSQLGLGYFSFVPQISDKKYGSYAISWSNFEASNLLREDTFSLTYADSYQFDFLETAPILAYGTNLKMLRRSFSTDERTDVDPVFNGGRDSNAVSFDLGLMARPNFAFIPGLKFGLSAQNVNEPDVGLNSTDKVPARYTLGVAYQERSVRYFNPALDVSVRDGRTLVSIGYEGWFLRDAFAVRAGGNEDQLGGGLGYQFALFGKAVMRLDYSILWPLDVDGTNGSHRFSLTTNF